MMMIMTMIPTMIMMTIMIIIMIMTIVVPLEQETVGSKQKKKKGRRIAAALEAKRLILSRIFSNMLQLQRKPILVARLLGRSIQDHMEVVVGVLDGDEAQPTLESYQATEYLPFTALSSQEIQRQMDPKAFAVDVDGVTNDEDPTTTTLLIDDALYMTYMLALDLASTQRMGGVDAFNTTLRSDFRDIGRAELTKLAPTMTKLSDTIHTTTTTTTFITVLPVPVPVPVDVLLVEQEHEQEIEI
mmetsp:Transcript_29611/g.33229  ORF Transcript_29611/g.33229 Transcript_29611/m.33229 type:complete len:243 (-) Transcript_29611:196-924(-)